MTSCRLTKAEAAYTKTFHTLIGTETPQTDATTNAAHTHCATQTTNTAVTVNSKINSDANHKHSGFKNIASVLGHSVLGNSGYPHLQCKQEPSSGQHSARCGKL